jgi:hypothetical protein
LRNVAIVEKGPAGMCDRIGDRGKAAAFPRAIRSNYAQDFSSTHRPAHVAQRNQRPVSNRQVFDPKDFSLTATISFRRCHPTIHISLLTCSG